MVKLQLFILANFIICSQGILYKLLSNASTENVTFRIIQRSNQGIIYFSSDQAKTDITLTLVRDENAETKLHLQYIKTYNTTNFNTLCGCSICTDVVLTFHLYYTDKSLHVTCNNRLPLSLIIGERNESGNYVQIFLGNNNKNGKDTTLSGCLVDFSYGNNPKLFKDCIHHPLFTICNNTCTEDLCNEGQCISTYLQKGYCDCSKAFLNGQFCNESGLFLKGSEYYQWKNNFEFTSLKVSWNSSQRNFVILEIKTNFTIIQIFLKNAKDIIMKERKRRKIVCRNTAHFVQHIIFINVVNNSLTFKCKNGNVTFSNNNKPFVFEEINLGFSQYLYNDFNLRGSIDFVYNNLSNKYYWIRPYFTRKVKINYFEMPIFMIIYSTASVIVIVFILLFFKLLIYLWSFHLPKSESVESQEIKELSDEVFSSLIYEELSTYDVLNYNDQDNPSDDAENDEYTIMTPTLPPRNF